MNIFEGKLPILEICATLPRSQVTAHLADVEQLADCMEQSGFINEKNRRTFIEFGDALHNGSLLNLWHKFLPRSMSVEKQAQAVQYAESILQRTNPDSPQFKNPDFTPAIEKFCGIDLAYNALVYSERELFAMLALSSQNKLNPIFNSYLSGSKNLILERDKNQIQLNQMLLNQELKMDENAQKTINYWIHNVPAGVKYNFLYGDLQDDLAKTLIENRHRVLGACVEHDKKVVTRHPAHSRPSSRGRYGR